MRVYAGERGPTTTTVVGVDQAAQPSREEVSEFIAELQKLDAAGPGAGAGRQVSARARKRDLLERIQLAEQTPPPVPLHRAGGPSPDGFDWGHAGSGAADLACSILAAELGEAPPAGVYLRFRDQVVAHLPRDRFELPASEVWRWVTANRAMVERELFGVDPGYGASAGPSLAVTDPDADRSGGPAVDPLPATASALVAACEDAWSAIQQRHPELPDAVIVLGSGVERGRLVKLGHWWAGRWVADGQVRGEVLLAGEALHLEPAEVFEVLLHESAHGINAARGVKDTSRGGRYHNAHFRDTAEEVGLTVAAMPPYGLAATSMSPAGKERYAAPIAALGDAMRIARQFERGVSAGAGGGAGVEGAGGAGREGSGGSQVAQCGCGRKMRMAPRVMAAGPVTCGVCGSEFATGVRADRTAGPAGAGEVVDGTFVARCQAAVVAGQPGDVERSAGALTRERDALGEGTAVGDDASSTASLDPRSRRHNRLKCLLAGLVGPGGTRPEADSLSAEQRAVLRDLNNGFREEDLVALADWYDRLDTGDEQPMRAAGAADVERRSRLARSLLKVDGTLTGAAIDVGGRELMRGDRVVAAVDDPATGVPAGTLGTVEHVDPAGGTVEVDFATFDRLRVSRSDPLGRSLRHDYAEESGLATGTRSADHELERERSLPGIEL